MRRIHILAIALLLGAAAAAGLLAATRTVDLGAAAPSPQLSDGAVAARTAKLDRLERSLQRALARRPPKLPKVPKVASSSPSPALSTSADGGVVYVQSQANTSVSSGGDDEEEYESEDAGESGHEHDD